MGFREFEAGGGAMLPGVGRADAPVGLRWSDPATWAGRPPGRNDIVHVPAGRALIIDQDVDVAALLLHGSATVAARDIAIRAAGILVAHGGSLRAGEPDRPFQHRLTVTPSQSTKVEALVGVGGKFLIAAEGGTIELNGPRRVAWSILADTVFPGGVVLKLTEPVDWRVGERVVIASGGTDLALVEERLVAAVGSDRLKVTLEQPLKHRHLGRNAPVLGALPGTFGKVALLSRDIVVEGDAASEQSSNGAYCLISPHIEETVANAPQPSAARFSGVEFRRMGQFNRPGRFPLYWSGNGASEQSAIINCVIHQSYQRGVVVAGSPGLRITGNVVYRPLGHGFIVDHADDGAALVTTNLVIRPRVVRYADPAMRAMCEHRPRPVWFALATRPRTVGLGVMR